MARGNMFGEEEFIKDIGKTMRWTVRPELFSKMGRSLKVIS